MSRYESGPYESGPARSHAPAAANASSRDTRDARPIVWRKSSYCQSGECLEVSALDGMILVRDSKAPQAGPLSYTADEFRAFIRGALAGEFNDLAGL